MQRFDGRDLGLSPHIAVLGSCKLGNFVVTIPMLRLLRNRYPDATIDFWGSEVTRDLEVALCRDTGPLNWRTSWDKNHSDINTLFNAFSNRLQLAGPLELLINCDGFNPFTQTLACLFRPKFLSGGGLRSDGRGLL